MRIYVAGPMTGIANFNFSAFKYVTMCLEELGHEVFNPAARVVKKYGAGICLNNNEGCPDKAIADFGFSLRETLGEDVAWICAHAEALCLLPGWEKSLGAKAEKALAAALHLKILYWPSSDFQLDTLQQ